MKVEKLPSLDLSFELVKNVLDKQSSTADALDTKATNLFMVASLILGIGLSAGILGLESINPLAYILGGFSIIGYGVVVGCSYWAWSLRDYQTLDNPITIREWYWDMEPTKFKIEWLSHLEDAYEHNQDKLDDKATAIRVIIGGVTAEVVLLTLSFALML